ncbi:MAG: hypothetical protein A2418_03445 [Candidatus Brennerbacteria bacterium RIFOXYC1_FULL_41_11]|nr:MAG: hypothetical protein A2418_03445 [Candidatus Brennerbacteria bacterium RIFOXYC1_FULL_41_11]
MTLSAISSLYVEIAQATAREALEAIISSTAYERFKVCGSQTRTSVFVRIIRGEGIVRFGEIAPGHGNQWFGSVSLESFQEFFYRSPQNSAWAILLNMVFEARSQGFMYVVDGSDIVLRSLEVE